MNLLRVIDDGRGKYDPQIQAGDEVFYCVSSFTEKDIPKAAQFRWHPTLKVWWTDSKKKASQLSDFAGDEELAKELSQIKLEGGEDIEPEKKTTFQDRRKGISEEDKQRIEGHIKRDRSGEALFFYINVRNAGITRMRSMFPALSINAIHASLLTVRG